MEKYYFKYEKGKAVVYNRTWLGDILEVASFKFGIDAKEYINFKNEKQNEP